MGEIDLESVAGVDEFYHPADGVGVVGLSVQAIERSECAGTVKIGGLWCQCRRVLAEGLGKARAVIEDETRLDARGDDSGCLYTGIDGRGCGFKLVARVIGDRDDPARAKEAGVLYTGRLIVECIEECGQCVEAARLGWSRKE